MEKAQQTRSSTVDCTFHLYQHDCPAGANQPPKMPITPGKRVTRSRAAATKTADEVDAPPKRAVTPKSTTSRRAKAAVDDAKKTEDTIASTVAKGPSHTTLKVAPAITATRRRIKVTPLDMPASEEKPAADAAADKPTTKKSKSSTREKREAKAEEVLVTDQQRVDDDEIATKPKSRRTAAVAKDRVDETQPPTRTRGRPKKAAGSKSTKETQQQQPVRQTRTRAGSGAAANQATAASTAKATATSRKKVTFQDLPESDKENQPLVVKKFGSKAQGVPAAGLRAKPVRKPATTKGRKTVGTKDKDVPEEPKPTPLSPKKVTQVAKSSSPGGSDEDELSGAKTPVKDLSQSPKRSAVVTGTLSPVKKLDFGKVLLSKSPEKAVPPTVLMSPARKLPPSPFKDALRESPKRGEVALIFPPSALKATTATAMSASTSQLQSVLLQSPKRGALDSSIFTQSAIKPLKSPAKQTLMQSPPKRLFISSKPPASEATPARANNLPPVTVETDLDTETRGVTASCHFRATQSPERSLRVHKISSEESALGAHATIDFDESVLDIRSPIKVSKPVPSPLQSTNEEAEFLPVFSADLIPAQVASDVLMTSPCQGDVDPVSSGAGEPMEGVAAFLTDEKVESGSTLAERAAPKVGPSFLFRSARFHNDDDESSEDELQSDITSFRNAQTATPGLSTKNVRPRLTTVNPTETSINVGFTPLAAQFSSWLATSPDKPLIKNTQQRGLFSPLAAQHVPGKVQVSRQSTSPRRSVSSRSSMVALSSADHRGANSVRKSYGSAMASTPGISSYFADEMAVKDLEIEVEGVPVTGEGDANPSEAQEQTELPTSVEEELPVSVPNLEAGDLDNAALNEEVSKDVQIQGDESLGTTSAALDCVSSEAEPENKVEAEAIQPTTAVEEPVSAATAEFFDNSENSKQSSPEAATKDREAVNEPSSSVEDYTTPTHQRTPDQRFANTIVSKVPLRPEGYISPIKMPKKRTRSLSAGQSPAKKPIFAPSLIPRSNNAVLLSPERHANSPAPETPGQRSFMVDDFGNSTLDGIEIDEDDENFPPPTPSAVIRSTITTPARSPLKAVENSALQGAVVFVDVHTTEGADASGIFIELLTQMGARCVKQWNWNPRASIAAAEAETENITPGGLAGKAGITHVVYKDGGKRTLEKVRDADGVVRCVGVGWVLE